MNHRLFAIAGVVSFLLIAPASATQQRSFVSSTGTDANPCTRDLPCRTFAAAISQTNAFGEVVAVDSAGYGAFSVTQPIAIVAPLGVHAGVSVFTGDGVDVNGSNIIVVLRNLYFNSQGGTIGIRVIDAATVHIEHCVVSGFSSTGIELTANEDCWVAIDETTVRDSPGGNGIHADISGFGLIVSISHSHLERLNQGVVADHAQVSVDDSTGDGISQAAFYARGTGGPGSMSVSRSRATTCSSAVRVDNGAGMAFDVSADGCSAAFYATGATAKLSVEHSATSNCVYGVDSVAGAVVSAANSNFSNGFVGVGAFTGGVVRLAHSSITGDTDFGIQNGSGTVTTTGDNLVEGNTTNLSGTTTPANKM